MIFGIELTGDRRATLRFDQFPTFAHDRLLAALQRIEQRLEAAVRAQVPVKTGKLQSLVGGHVYDHVNRIAAVVGIVDKTQQGARKAAALEFGSRGVSIAMHRVTSTASLLARANRPLKSEWRRTPTLQPHRFLRGPLDAIRGSAIAEMRAAIDQAIADSG